MRPKVQGVAFQVQLTLLVLLALDGNSQPHATRIQLGHTPLNSAASAPLSWTKAARQTQKPNSSSSIAYTDK